ncbi:HD domain-containing protein [Pseudoalteromonas shioyasakiensis]|uniref:HD domain-containing protein n=1 Tax=Pseudoalteromonas shioyasakiensis TaxID=1190813 RepID=UPI002118BF84|nr:HD domain-containing protein [Pseudoalteromonas shioyasakiensis]MCQ8876538.1 HD domain-containing protein [Pseudoalteromonas shioyasakiensis]
MMDTNYVWVQKITIIDSMPIAHYALIINQRLVHAITSIEVARASNFIYGLAYATLSKDKFGNIILCRIKTIDANCNLELFETMMLKMAENKSNLIGRFLRLLSYITLPTLTPFSDFILTRQNILDKFLIANGADEHHAYQHGLLEHSIEVAEMAYSNARRLHYNELDCQVILISALFQDIGNIFTLIFNQQKAAKYQSDANFNFAILAEPLAKLATMDTALLRNVTQMLTLKSAKKTEYSPAQKVLLLAEKVTNESKSI